MSHPQLNKKARMSPMAGPQSELLSFDMKQRYSCKNLMVLKVILIWIKYLHNPMFMQLVLEISFPWENSHVPYTADRLCVI